MVITMSKQLEKLYDPKQVESRIYDFWLEGGYFHAVVNPDKKPYTIMMPPPNITGQLHLGHALDNAMQDSLIRFKRMQGYEALWMPGTDHAAIATEAKIVEDMKKDGVTKADLGRDGFMERAWEWRRKYGGRITEQLKKLGSSCDWERESFTMDDRCSHAVREVFVRLFEQDLIYRGERIINWCPHCLTSISDAEVEYEEKDGHFWHIKYPIVGEDGYLELATTRPETMLGDTAVAVHPDDERYKHLIGKNVLLPIVGKEIPVIADDYVEMDFGTGVVKITPAHDPNDFEVGLRHNLPVINVMHDDGSINENGGRFAGMTGPDARKAIVKQLEDEGFLRKVEDIKHNVGACYRCAHVVEPRVSKQWFVKMKPLAEPAIEVVKSGETKFIPERFDKIYFHWMENIKDWCISRQLWWGHRIPAFYCAACGQMTVSRDDLDVCPHCASANIAHDPDTLDTWFSSALWPFSTLGWPENTPELDYFYPTDTLVTGYDIIFFWVARMIFSGVAQMKKTPFHTVFIHGIIRDAQGRKMSKSLGNGIDPLEVIENFGADALRLTLLTGNSPGNDMRFSEEKITASRNFSNKLWNASRFVLMNVTDAVTTVALPDTLAVEDKWIISKYNTLVAEITDNLEKYELGMAVAKLYDFIWNVYCDWYIELTKPRLLAGGDTSLAAQQVLVFILSNTLKLLHPFMPFITEEIWQALPHEGDTIMTSAWPVYDGKLSFTAEETEFERVMLAIKGIRNRRSEMNVPPSKKASVFIVTDYPETFEQGKMFIERLAFASSVELGNEYTGGDAVSVITDSARIFIPMQELVDLGKERERLQKEIAACQKDVAFLAGKLGNAGFVAKAPAAVIEQEKAKLKTAEDKLAKISESLAALG